MAVTRAKCECGEDFAIPLEEAQYMDQDEAQNWLLDGHKDHRDKFKSLGL